MGIKDLDASEKTIKPFRQDICVTSELNNWTENSLPNSSSPQSIESATVENQSNNQRQRQRRPDRAVYVPRGRRSQTTPRTSTSTSTSKSQCGSVPKTSVFHKENANVIDASNSVISPSQSGEAIEINPQMSEMNSKEATVEEPSIDRQLDVSEQKHNYHIDLPGSLDEHPLTPAKVDSIETMADTDHKNANGSKIETTLNSSDKDYNEDKEFQRASKEINRRNRRIIKQTFDSDILEINEKSSVTTAPLPPTTSTSESNNLKKSKLPQKDLQANVEKTSMPKAPQPIEQSSLLSSSSNGKNMAVNAETDDWESIFDDNGECSDPKLIDEITANVGKVTITKPKNDYKCYQETVNLDDEEFPHVLEVSNFPVEFKTQDLMMVFSEYKDLGFDIKWVDDTHALVVFSSSKIAARVLNTGHAFVKLKPLTQATVESKARAKKSSLFLQPYRQRPETCAALARRLVTGALGVRLSTAREEREIERRVLKEAKERKMMAAKLRDEAWEN